jgi:membrane associated rhomboid family serine protease/Zn-finger nucleic acid-binding protein
MKCPHCPSELQPVILRHVQVGSCPSCKGLWFETSELAKFNHFDSDFPLYPDHSFDGTLLKSRCPQCEQLRLSRIPYSPGSKLYVERCSGCKGVWLDAGEIKKVRNILARKVIMHRRLRRLNDVVRREQEMWETYMERVAEEEDKRKVSTSEWLFMFLTRLPTEVWNPTRHVPKATITLVVINVFVFALQQFFKGSAAIHNLAFIPDQFRQGQHFYNVVTAMFLHGSMAHIAANLYFLYTFGDNVEDFLGWLNFTLLYLACGLTAQMSYFFSNMHSTIPALGASGAISGLIAAYMILFSRRKIFVMIVAWPVRIRAVWCGVFWLLLQILGAAEGRTGIAWSAHIGGFIAGAALIQIYLGCEHEYAPATFP